MYPLRLLGFGVRKNPFIYEVMPSILYRVKPQTGLHLSFAGLGAYRLFRRLTGSYKAGGLAGGMLLFLYVSMIGMTVSVLRAWVMFLFRVGADVTGRKYDMPTALSVAAVIAVGSNPLYLYDGGFLLSFGALLAICTVIPLVKEESQQPVLVRILGPGIAMNCVLWPVILYFFFEVPLYSDDAESSGDTVDAGNIILRDGRLTCADGRGNIWNMDIDGVQPDIKTL